MSTSLIHGYKVIGNLTTNNAGFCQWGFCERDEREYFIKEFLSPVYPLDNINISEKTLERKRKICEDYYTNKKEFYDALNCCRTGNNILIQDFFRCGSKYYITTDKVEADGSDPALIACLSHDKKETLLRSILFSISKLHQAKIVHADIKPDNVLLKKTNDGFYTAKIIDFDAGFLVGKQPKAVQGDFTYLAPETFRTMNDEEVELTEKIDIFALGILFHQYLTGKIPTIGNEYRYIHEAVLDGSDVQLSNDIPSDLKTMISSMLSCDPTQRPSAEDLLAYFREKDVNEDVHEEDVLVTTDIPEETKTIPCENKPTGFYRPEDLD